MHIRMRQPYEKLEHTVGTQNNTHSSLSSQTGQFTYSMTYGFFNEVVNAGMSWSGFAMSRAGNTGMSVLFAREYQWYRDMIVDPIFRCEQKDKPEEFFSKEMLGWGTRRMVGDTIGNFVYWAPTYKAWHMIIGTPPEEVNRALMGYLVTAWVVGPTMNLWLDGTDWLFQKAKHTKRHKREIQEGVWE